MTSVLRCVGWLERVGVLVEEERPHWVKSFSAFNGLEYEHVSSATVYLHLVEASKRLQCFSELGFSPLAKDFYVWAARHGLDYFQASQLSWVSSCGVLRGFGGPDYLTLVHGGAGFVASDIIGLSQYGGRLGPECVVGLGFPDSKVKVCLEDVLPDSVVMQLKETVGIGPCAGSVAGDLREMLDKLENAERNVKCESDVGQFAGADDVVAYGTRAMVNVSQIRSVVGTYEGPLLDRLGCYCSVRDLTICYVGAMVEGKAVGGKLEDSGLGTVLVPDPGLSVADTVKGFVDYWQSLEGSMAVAVESDCVCGERAVSYTGCEVLGLVSFDGVDDVEPGGFLEFECGGGVTRHCKGCPVRSRYGKSYVATVRELRSAVEPSFDRWIHERAHLCCEAVCGCWKFGARELRGGLWMVTRHFICRGGGLVKGFSRFGHLALVAGGFRPAEGQSEYGWYVFDERLADALMDALDPGDYASHLVGLACSLECVRMRLLTVANWFQYLDEGDVTVVDVLHAVGFRRVGGRNKVRGRDDGDPFEFVSGPYMCSCGSRHYRGVGRVCGGDVVDVH